MSKRAGNPWRVLVVEDDRHVAMAHCRIVAGQRDFDVVGVVPSAERAARSIGELSPDLVLLDLGLPHASGHSLLRHLRARDQTLGVIVVTGQCSGEVVRSTVSLGIVDYVIKPFLPARLIEALRRFDEQMTTLHRRELSQDHLDRVVFPCDYSEREPSQRLARDRLSAVEDALSRAEDPVSAEDLAQVTGMARVTARRYLEALVSAEHAHVSLLCGSRGRPRKLYSHAEPQRVG